MPLTLARLRASVVRRSLFRPTTLSAAVERMGFVQADPIRAPARAQDLILRHRVAGYREGDLERAYPSLGLDEDVLYAYGFVTPAVRRLLHPGEAKEPDGLAGEVLACVREIGEVHPREAARRLGTARERNAWGGQSLATTRALEGLHARGLLRVARRDRGVRVYAVAPPGPEGALSPSERLRGLVLLLARMFAPLPETGLRRVLRYVPFVRRHAPATAVRAEIAALLRTGALEGEVVGGERWVWPEGEGPRPRERVPKIVRLLAPFDPVVWDRERFTKLWGWEYRFEGYVPEGKRVRGYYALPVLEGERVGGWANVGRGGVEWGFVGEEVGREEREEEEGRIEWFLGG
ncbi:MAG TPA: crosslink repair DNA glycosylase YcaQ family protein, partial [Gemmatirosa sp.]